MPPSPATARDGKSRPPRGMGPSRREAITPVLVRAFPARKAECADLVGNLHLSASGRLLQSIIILFYVNFDGFFQSRTLISAYFDTNSDNSASDQFRILALSGSKRVDPPQYNKLGQRVRLFPRKSCGIASFQASAEADSPVQAVLVLYSYVYYNRDYTKPLSGAPTNSGCFSSRKAALPTPAEPKLHRAACCLVTLADMGLGQ